MHSVRAAFRCLGEGIRHARVQYWCYRHYRRLSQERDAAFASYLGKSPRCLHIGAADFVLENWFNTDLDPWKQGVFYLDATQPLPFPAQSFDFIFSEHMVEHIPFSAGLDLLKGCRRVLKPSGVIRLATPDLRNILALISNHNPDSENYLRWAVETFKLPGEPFPKAPVVINNFFRSWGHQFLYDPETMRRAMESAGFCDIIQQPVGVSRHAPLQGLEHHGEVFGQWVNQFETMVFEGTAP